MKILVLNAGSSSIKYSLIDMDGQQTLLSGLIERIGEASSRVRTQGSGAESGWKIARLGRPLPNPYGRAIAN